jgi:enoyl-[acyl-carrier protein] reductase I
MKGLLDGKNAVVTGIANKNSIAWAIIQGFQQHGANVIGTVLSDRFKHKAEALDNCPPILIMDAAEVSSIEDSIKSASQMFNNEPIDCFVHCIAYADREELKGRFIDGARERSVEAFTISAESLRDMARIAEPYMAENGSLIYLTFVASELVFPFYNSMALAKAALETSGRYLAEDLGRSKRIRVNGVSAGPISTLSARGIGKIDRIFDVYEKRAPLGNISAEDAANAAVFLASDLSRNMTGTVLYVDGGFRAIGISVYEEQSR